MQPLAVLLLKVNGERSQWLVQFWLVFAFPCTGSSQFVGYASDAELEMTKSVKLSNFLEQRTFSLQETNWKNLPMKAKTLLLGPGNEALAISVFFYFS